MGTREHVYQLASQDGAGSVFNANGDYSVTPGSFEIHTLSNEVIHLERLIVGIRDTAINNSTDYGAMSELANGVLINVRKPNGDLIESITPFPIKTNGDWAMCCHDLNIFDLGNGDDYITVRWTFSKIRPSANN